MIDRSSSFAIGLMVVAIPAWIALSAEPAASDIVGPARVIDGDTIVIASTHIRLFGIDAPESRQTCQGRDGAVYECGRDSAAVLGELTRGREVRCTEQDIDRYRRIVAICWADGKELNAAMVRRGWAVEYRRYDRGLYRADEEAARAEGLGIWSGRFEMPAQWRRERR